MLNPYGERRKRLFEHLTDSGVEIAMATSPVTVLYLTGTKIKPYERFMALVLNSKTGEATFILPGLERSVNTDKTIAEVFYGDHEDPFSKLMDVLKTFNILGIEKDWLSFTLAEKIGDLFDGRFVDISPPLRELRLSKDSDEVDNIKTAAAFNDQIYGKIRERLHPGLKEKEIAFLVLQCMSSKPGVSMDSPVIQVLGGRNSANPHGSSGDRRIEKGDPVTIDFGVNFAHYWSDTTRTFFLGDPEPQFETIYRTVLEAQKRAIEKVRPGVPMREIDLTARKVIEEAGYGASFIHRTGHGIGLDIHEMPSVHNRNASRLQEGMVITVEPGIYLPGLGGVRIEDDVVVVEEGCLVLTDFPKQYEDMIIGS